MAKLSKILAIVGGFIASLFALAVALFRAFGKGAASLDPFEGIESLYREREKEKERIREEIKKESDQALADRFNKLAKKEKGKKP